MNDFTAALSKAKRLVRDHAKTAAIMVRLNTHGEPSAWMAQLATEPAQDARWITAGYVSVTGLVRAAHEEFSRAYRHYEASA